MEVGSSFSIAQALPQFAVSVGDYLRLQNVAANIPDETAGRELKSLKRWERLEIEFLRARRSGANLILLDEVTAGLSADEIERALALVAEMKVSATVVMVSHQAIPDGQFDHRLRFERGQIYVS
jgi:ABC-type branched-subunit amino acid transport system ATPase component